jgi:hypothetical protein
MAFVLVFVADQNRGLLARPATGRQQPPWAGSVRRVAAIAIAGLLHLLVLALLLRSRELPSTVPAQAAAMMLVAVGDPGASAAVDQTVRQMVRQPAPATPAQAEPMQSEPEWQGGLVAVATAVAEVDATAGGSARCEGPGAFDPYAGASPQRQGTGEMHCCTDGALNGTEGRPRSGDGSSARRDCHT